MTRFNLFAIAFASTIGAGCPPESDDPGATSTSSASTSIPTTSTSADSITEDSSTGLSMSTSSSETSGDAPTTEAPIVCGVPAAECSPLFRVWCEDFVDICRDAGLDPPPGSGTTNYCDIIVGTCDEQPACQMCFNVANICGQLGKGQEFCDFIFADCLCRAAALGVDINN